jgi:GTPase SAR1 family protein
MVLTEFDYDDYASFREALFRQLDSDLLTSDVLIVGQSLSDRHLKAVVTQAAHLQATRGAQGRLFLLVYEPDKARASLYHRRGITTSSGSLEDFFYVLSATQPPVDPEVVDDAQRLLLKPTLRTAALDVDQVTGSANAARLFNGRPATYADIRAQLTFMRSAHPRLVGFMQGPDRQFLTLLGVAGVGKTTLARQLMLGLLGEGNYCWEAVKELPLSAEEWLHVDDQLREQGAEGVLLIDECTPELRQVNLLADGLAARGAGGLKLILTASSVQWRPRRKSPALYAKGHEETLSLLDTGDVRRMVELVETQPAIRDLADDAFRRLTTGDKLTRLTARASADMFVCLKYIFATEALDTILLEEYAKLQESQREIYRLVAALQASGGKVHRQMVLRQASLRADQIPDFLRSMEGIVDEHEASRKLGIYVWDTRHELIARVIAAYSYSDESELAALLADVIQNLSPTMHIELQSLREMCNAEFGVRALREPSERIRLFRLMIEVAPQERIPRHRIIREHLALGDLDSASYAVREAEEAVGLDRPVQRYKVQLDLQRAKSLTMAPEHRLAMLRSAERGALYALERFPDDKFSYSTYGDVGVAFGETTGDLGPLDEALRHLADASERLLDPQLSEDLLRFDRVRERLRGKASQEKR